MFSSLLPRVSTRSSPVLSAFGYGLPITHDMYNKLRKNINLIKVDSECTILSPTKPLLFEAQYGQYAHSGILFVSEVKVYKNVVRKKEPNIFSPIFEVRPASWIDINRKTLIDLLKENKIDTDKEAHLVYSNTHKFTNIDIREWIDREVKGGQLHKYIRSYWQTINI